MIDIVPIVALHTQHAAPDRDTVRAWSTVLASQGLLYELDRDSLRVTPALAEYAVEQILAYEAENLPAPPRVQHPDTSWISLMVITLALLCMAAVDRFWPDVSWHQLGRADAGLIMQGEWWRCVTALFLHADAGHLLANLAALALLTALLGRNLGFGLAWGLFVLSGGAGNAVNAWFHSPAHLSVGASTGVFGLLGVLACAARGNRAGHIFVALGFALSFLALLGAGDQRVDLGAHAFGLMAGLAAGATLAAMRPRPWLSPLAGAMALAITIGSWWTAWLRSP